MKRIVFVGSNPSEASSTNTAFEPGTSSMTMLIHWVNSAGLSSADKYHANVYNHKTPKNRPLTAQEVETGIKELKQKIRDWKYTHIVGLGKTVTKALTKHGIKHLALPHPSGLNRQLNDPKFVEDTIRKLKEYYESEG